MDKQFGPYRLVEQIAVGGMAEIYLAKTAGIAGFEKYVALKMIHPNFSEDREFIQMLIDEAKITVLLQHVNIAQTFDLGRVGSRYYITMEFVDGADLYKLLRKGSEIDLDVPIDVAAHIAKEVATGLDYAHRKRDMTGRNLGIVHRDVSPQNVLISFNGEIKLVDFGIAKASMRARQTAAGVIKGKYYYMSPEQAWGEPVDKRTDIFSAGILLYEMLTGQMLYLEEDLRQLLELVRAANIAPPTTLRPDVPPELSDIVMKALQKDREKRYQTANDMATDLGRFLHDHSPVLRAPKVAEWVSKALADELESIDDDEGTDSGHHSRVSRISEEQFVRARSEITDENSMIFRLSDYNIPAPGTRKNTDLTAEVVNKVPPLPRLPGPKRPRSSEQETKNSGQDVDRLLYSEDADGDEDRTVVSQAPSFVGDRDVASNAKPMPGGESSFDDSSDKTVVDYGFQGADQGGESTTENTNVEDENTHSTVTRRRDRSQTSPRPPALLASNPSPAHSELRPKRPSRRTPAAGVPVKGSVLSKLLSHDPAPPAGMPFSTSAPTEESHGGDGFDRKGDGTTVPFINSSTKKPPALYGDLPTGAPTFSTEGRLAQLEVDDIPAAFKLAHGASQRRRRLIAGFAVIALCVLLGVGIGMFLFAGGAEKPRVKTLEVVSIPKGATVTLDGRDVEGATPLLIRDLGVGSTYLVEISAPGFRTWSSETEVGVEGSEVIKVIARLEPILVSLRVISEPGGAEVFIGGNSVGRTPVTLTELDPKSATSIELRLKGYRPIHETLEWNEETSKTLRFELNR